MPNNTLRSRVGNAYELGLPAEELEWFRRFVADNPWLLKPRDLGSAFNQAGMTVWPSADWEELNGVIADAIQAEQPLSVIRLGDGEGNILTYGAYRGLSQSDGIILDASIGMHEDRVLSTPENFHELQRRMLESILDADVIGCIPLRPRYRSDNQLMDHPRSTIGTCLGVHYLVDLAQTAQLAGKIAADVDICFYVLAGMPRLPSPRRGVIAITSRAEAVSVLREWLPETEVRHVRSGLKDRAPRPDPETLVDETMAELPQDLRGWLCLVGAGPWSEFHCHCIKSRGGVGIDLGSGFDLLEGHKPKMRHKRVDTERLRAGVELASALALPVKRSGEGKKTGR